MAFVTDIVAMFASTFQDVTVIRTGASLPALQPAGLSNFQIGSEFLANQDDAPRIVIVPTDVEYDFSQQVPVPPNIAGISQASVYRRWLIFDAHIWGDPDLTALSFGSTPVQAYDFNSTIELERQFVISMYGECTGGSFRPDRARWMTQPEGTTHRGRVLVLTFRVATPLVQQPFTLRPYSVTSGDGGVVGVTTVQEIHAGSTTIEIVGTVIAPPA